jgi:hypothetical protein
MAGRAKREDLSRVRGCFIDFKLGTSLKASLLASKTSICGALEHHLNSIWILGIASTPVSG